MVRDKFLFFFGKLEKRLNIIDIIISEKDSKTLEEIFNFDDSLI